MGCRAPSDPVVAHLHEGEAALAVGSAAQAAEAFRGALAIAPTDVRALEGLLRAETDLGNAASALAILAEMEAAGLSPARPARCAALALAIEDHLERGASAALEVARTSGVHCGGTEPTFLIRALIAEGDRERGDGNLEAAFELYREVIELGPGDPSIFGLAAELLVRQDRIADAVSLLAVGLERYPGDRELREQMVRVLSIR